MIGDGHLAPSVGHGLAVRPIHELQARRSKKWQTHPQDVLPLTIAETDFDLAPAVTDALTDAIARSDTGYAYPTSELRRAFTRFAARQWAWELDQQCITAVSDVGVGAVELLRLLSRLPHAVISPPIYPPFFGWIEEAGMAPVEVPLDPDGWTLDLGQLERTFAASGSAVYLLCNPHNPVGRVHSRDELVELVRIARNHDVVIISDEIHAPLMLGRTPFTPLLTVEGAGDIAVSIHSASKAWNLAGLKCAIVIATSDRMRQVVSALPPGTSSRIGHFGVIAATAAYRDTDDWLRRLRDTLSRRRDELDHLLRSRLPQLAWQPPDATFLAWIDASALGSGDGPRDAILEHGRVAVQSGRAFGAPKDRGFCRLNFATSAEILDVATARIAYAAARTDHCTRPRSNL